MIAYDLHFKPLAEALAVPGVIFSVLLFLFLLACPLRGEPADGAAAVTTTLKTDARLIQAETAEAREIVATRLQDIEERQPALAERTPTSSVANDDRKAFSEMAARLRATRNDAASLEPESIRRMRQPLAALLDELATRSPTAGMSARETIAAWEAAAPALAAREAALQQAMSIDSATATIEPAAPAESARETISRLQSAATQSPATTTRTTRTTRQP